MRGSSSSFVLTVGVAAAILPGSSGRATSRKLGATTPSSCTASPGTGEGPKGVLSGRMSASNDEDEDKKDEYEEENEDDDEGQCG